MNILTCFSPLMFYDNINKQNHKKNYAYNSIKPLMMKLGIIDPFQICLYKTNFKYIKNAFLCNKKEKLDILEILKDNGLKIYNISDYTLIEYPGKLNIPYKNLNEGFYYIEIEINNNNTTQHLFSEIFCFSENVNNYLTIIYNNPQNYFYLKNGIINLKDFEFIVRLQTELGKPEYSFEEEATKRLGYSFIESQISKKTYKFNALLPEYLCDALRVVRLCSHKKIINNEIDEYEALSFEMDVDWQEQGDIASVNFSFDVDNIIYNNGDFEITEKDGDFLNTNFNNDFKLQ